MVKLVIDEGSIGGEDSGKSTESQSVGGIVVCSRVRLVRNIADFPFVNACSDDQRSDIESTVKAGLVSNERLSNLTLVDSDQLEMLERQFLVNLEAIEINQQLSSSDQATASESTASESDASESDASNDAQEDAKSDESQTPQQVATEASASRLIVDSSLMVNEEDHLRIQVTHEGLDLQSAWSEATELDDLIESQLNYAFSPRWGYLTACPANVGTGMRVSVVLHLPALVITESIDAVLRGLSRIDVAGRELFGDLSGGDFFRISNQVTLGQNESDLIDQVGGAVPMIVQAEREARELLLEENREGLRRQVSLAMVELLKIDLDDLSEENRMETTRLLSRVRMGIGMGLLPHEDAEKVAGKFELVQLRQSLSLAIEGEDYQRASRLRDRIQILEGGSA